MTQKTRFLYSVSFHLNPSAKFLSQFRRLVSESPHSWIGTLFALNRLLASRRRSFFLLFCVRCARFEAASKRRVLWKLFARKRTQTDVWHICVDCTAWPNRNYAEKWVELSSVDPSTICIQCLQRRREGKCRMCGPGGATYELERRSTKLRQLG